MTLRLFRIYCFCLLAFSLQFLLRYHEDPPVFIASVSTFLLASLVIIVGKKPVRWLLCLSFTLLMLSVFHRVGKVNNTHHIWIFAGFFMGFLELEKPLRYKRNALMLGLVQTTLLSEYFIAGLWKLRTLLSTSLGDFLSQPLDHIAYAVAEGNGPLPWVLSRIENPAFAPLLQAGLLLVLCFELSCAVPVLTGRNWKRWGFLSLGFHAATGLFLGIWFFETAIASMVFLIYAEILARREIISPQS